MAKAKEVAILFDSSHCTGCKGCQVACKQWNMLPSPMGLNENKFTGSYQSPMDLNGNTRLIMTFDEKESGNKFQPLNFAIGRRSCYHCTDAACVEICSSGALYHKENGVVAFDTDKCNGCTYCQSACPFDVPRFRKTDNRIDKCTLCFDRLEEGGVPACVKTCQPEALKFGPRAGARWNTANVESFFSLPWDARHAQIIKAQMESAREQMIVPGGYFTGRHIINAWNSVVVNNKDARDMLEKAVKDINKELNNKRKEFGLDN